MNKLMKNLWTSFEQVVNKSLTNHEQVDEQVMNNSWTRYKQGMNKTWKTNEKVIKMSK